MKLTTHPLTPDRWMDFETLFGERGACGGCWCMVWRLKTSDWERRQGEANRKAMKALVDSGVVPGILGYVGGKPIAWCAVALSESILRLERSRTLRRLDDLPTWSITCFFIHKDFRRQGISSQLLEAAAKYVKSRSGRVVEGYPVVVRKGKLPDPFIWTGIVSMFEKAGFEVAAKPSATRRIVRRYV